MNHLEICEMATQGVRELSKKVNPRFYPNLHFTPPAGWINDPNGLIYFNQKYHLFYQHYPYSGFRGPMHWGHAISDDLLNWEHLPVALAPGEKDDVHGVYSGSAIEHDGTLFLFYTGHTIVKVNENGPVYRQVQMLATSQDGLNFQKHGVVVDCPKNIENFRDPKVWREGDIWKMIVGVSEDNTGQVWIYQSSDLYHWEFDQVLLKAKKDQGWMWECPDLFQLGDKWVLVLSPMGMQPKGYSYNNHFQVGYFVGHFENSKFIVDKDFTELDNGLDLYAPQTFSGIEDRQIMVSWFSMPETKVPEQIDHWSSCLTFPREITLTQNNDLIQSPIKELELLRKSETVWDKLSLNDKKMLFPENGESCEISVEINLSESKAERMGLLLAYDPETDKGVRLYVDRQSQRLYLDRSGTGFGPTGIRSIALPEGDKLSLRVILDKSTCEIFVNDGVATLSARIYPDYPVKRVGVYSENGVASFEQLRSYELQSIWVKRFPFM